MPEYLHPGVYIEEIERGPKPIEGASTSTAAFLGATLRGPTRPRLVTSLSEYLRIFGGYQDDLYLPYAVKAFFDNGGRRVYICRLVGGTAAPSSATISGLDFTAVGPGAVYDQTFIEIAASSTTIGVGTPPIATPIGFRVLVYFAEDGTDIAALPADERTAYLQEDFDDLSIDPASVNYFEKIINDDNSSFIEVAVDGGGALGAIPAAAGPTPLAGGDGTTTLTAAEYTGDESLPSEDRTGLAALKLDAYRDVAIVHAPAAPDDAARAVVTHCERSQRCFAVIDVQRGQGNVGNIDPRTDLVASQYAAFYYPWIFTSEPRNGQRKLIPPGGAVCGIYALTDNTRGVFKAPANEVVAGAIDLEFDVNDGEQDILNPRGVNVLRRFPGRGIRVWGARTLSADPLWKYVNVRRLFIFLESSIFDSTQWVVFEPNNERLWSRVKETITLFLRTQWQDGALLGAKEEEAFTVAVGRDTMTQDDILNGRLIVEVGIAPTRPAEFVIFRIFQKTQEAKS